MSESTPALSALLATGAADAPETDLAGAAGRGARHPTRDGDPEEVGDPV
jgi:hypothetical protein